MKKVYAKLAGGKLNFLRPIYKTSFVKMLSLSSVVALLSSASPVYSKTVSPKEAFLISAKSPSVAFPQSVISVYDDYNYDDYNVDASDQENYVTALQGGSTLAASAVSDYVNFLINTLSKNSNDNSIVNILAAYSNSLPKREFSAEEQYKKFIISAQNGENTATIDALNPLRNDSMARMQRGTGMQRDVEVTNVIFGNDVQRGPGMHTSNDVVAIGTKIKVYDVDSVAVGYGAQVDNKYTVAVGHLAYAVGKSSIAIGGEGRWADNPTPPEGRTIAKGEESIAIGRRVRANGKGSIAFGAHSKAEVETSVALGAESVANIVAGVAGYDSLTKEATTNTDFAWKSTMGAVSVGNVAGKKTRQITGLAAGSADSDAVNVAQLKSLQGYVDKGWKLSVGGANAKAIGIDSSVDFSAGSNNFTIAKGEDDNKVTFDLAKSLTVDSIKIGNNTLDATGLIITDGPKVTTTGIDAGNKKITGVEKGTGETDAVNFAQLEEIKEQVASGSFVKQDAQTKHITIGKEADGDKISIANKDGKGRVISGIANGAISDASTEAMTGHQLHQFGTSIAGYFGGGAKYENGQWSTPKFKVKTVKDDGTESEQSYENVASAFEGVSNSITKIQNNITKEINNVVTKVEGDSLSWSKTDDAFVAKHGAEDAKTNSKIRFLANGDVSKDSTDAITGSQLYLLKSTLATYFGGGGGYDQEGNWKAPSFKIKKFDAEGAVTDEAYGDVAAALEGVGASITNVQNKITKEITNQVNNAITKVEGDSFVQQDKETHLITIGAKKGGAEINIADSTGVDRTLSGLKEATKDNEAVNKAQLDKNLKELSNNLQSDDSAVVHYDKTDGDKGTINYGSVTLGGKNKAPVGLHNVSSGVISSASYDAINGQQINKIGEDVAGFFGGNATFKNGTFTKPSYEVHSIRTNGEVGASGNVHHDVGSALSALNYSLGNVNTRITNTINDFNQKIMDSSQHIEKDALLWNDKVHAFVARHEKSTEEKGRSVRTQENSKITFLANGDVSKASTDAITGSQLYSLKSMLATYFGGGAGYDKEGNWKAPSFEVKKFASDGSVSDTTYNDVASAFKGVGDSFTNVKNEISKEITNVKNEITNVKGDSLVKWDEATKLIKIGEEKEGSQINITNKNGDVRTISGVAAGSAETDAVNFSQLQKVEKDVKEQVAASSFVKQDLETKHLTIGKETDGDKIDIANNKNEKRTLTGIKGGALSADSNEAVTGSQLFTTNQNVTTAAMNIAKSFGGGAKYEHGQWTAPTFKVKSVKDDGVSEDKVYTNVATAFEGVGSSIMNVQNKFTEQINNVVQKVESESFVQQDKATHSLTIGAKTQGSKIDIANKDGVDRTLSGIKAATKDNEAVNKEQLDESLKKLSTSLQSDESAVVHYDKTDGENNTINYASVTFGKGKDSTSVGLHNVADGKIAKDSRDVVTGGQINTISQEVAKYLGGGTAFIDGAFTRPAYNLSKIEKNGLVTDTTFQDVGKAFEGLDTNIQNVNQRIKEVSEGVAQDSLLWSDEAHAFVARHEKKQEEQGRAVAKQENSKITFLLDGTVSKDSTDAVTGSQLYSVGNALSTYLGGGAKYENGEWIAPSFKVKTIKDDGSTVEDKEYKTVAEALAGVGTSITNVKKEISNEITNVVSDSLVKRDETTNLITIGKEVEGSEINIVNKDGADRTLSGIKAATKDNEAVNKKQLEEHLKDLSTSLQSDESAVVHYDKKEGDETDYTNVTFGKGKASTSVGLHNVADGKIAKDSRDVVTGGQINTISQEVAKYLGGGTAFIDGAFTGPAYNLSKIEKNGLVTDTTFQDVGKAFEGLDTNIQNVNQRIKEVSEGVAQDSLLWSDEAHAFVARHEKKQEEQGRAVRTQENSKITFLLDGNVSEGSTDAVTGNQLYSMGHALSMYLGGDAKYEKGKWSAPSFKVKTVKEDGSGVEEKSYESVASAFEGVGSSFTNIKNELKNEITNVVSDSLVKQDAETKVINIGKEVEGSEINIANKDKEDRTLSGVKEATKNNEAVNKGQLDKRLEELSKNIQSEDSAVVLYDKGENGTTNYKSVTLGKGENREPVALHNVADGKIAENSHDAINGSQINKISQDLGKFLGGNAVFNNGAFTGPTYKLSKVDTEGKVEQTDFNDVGSAFTGLNDNIKNVNQRIKEVSEGVAQDSLSWSKDDHAFVAKHGAEKTASKIKFVAGGDLSENSTDAVNGTQLFETNDKVATYLGGGAKYDGGKWKAPTFMVKSLKEDGTEVESSYNDVASAFAGVGNSITKIHKEVKNEINQVVADSLVKQEDKTNRITIGKEVEGSEIDIANKTGADRTLSGVKAATQNNEAVNKGQLDASLKDLSNSLQSEDSAVVLYDKTGGENSTTNYESITFGKGKDRAPVGLHNVADGTIDEKSRDVVTGGQIHTISQEIAKYLGGGTVFNNGTFTGPTYKLSSVNATGEVEEKSYNDVGSAFGGLDTNVKNVNNNLTNKFNELTQNITNITQEVQGDALLWNKDEEAFVAQHGEKKGNSKITSLANGNVAEGSTDAVTGGQLYSLNNTVATYFGGGAKYEEGKWTAPTFTVKTFDANGKEGEESYTSVAEAFTGVNNAFISFGNKVTNEITNQVNNAITKVEGESLVKKDKKTKVIAIGGETDGTSISLANIDGTARTLSGVKDGALSAVSTEAVNGSQLYSLGDKVATYLGGGAKYENGELVSPGFKVVTFNDDGSSEEQNYTDVAAAFAGVSNSFTKLHHEISDNIEQNALLWSEADKAFVALHGTGETKQNSKLIHLVDGDISAGSSEAITGNQLYQLNQTLALYFGGDAGYKDGVWTAPKFQVSQFNLDGSAGNKEVYDNVASAFEGVNGSMSSINDRINTVEQNVSSNSLNWDEKEGAYNAGHAGQDSKITHVADGKVASGSKDAVNGGQLFETNERVSAVESQVSSIDKQVKDIESTVTNGVVKYDQDGEGHKVNKVTLVGVNESDPVLIDNVGDGKIESGSKEAVNGGQLHDYTEQQMKIVLDDAKKYTDDKVDSAINNAADEAKSYTDMKFGTLSYAVQDIRKEARQAAAIGLAVANLSYDDTPGKLSVTFGSGVWRNQSAFALGAGYMSENGRMRSNLSVTSAGGHWGVGAGFRVTLN